MTDTLRSSRRDFLKSSGLLAAASALPAGIFERCSAVAAPAPITSDALRPAVDQGIQIGDLTPDRAAVDD
jgi:phosphodiesterase/alkaline phosphatase D-like protein